MLVWIKLAMIFLVVMLIGFPALSSAAEHWDSGYTKVIATQVEEPTMLGCDDDAECYAQAKLNWTYQGKETTEVRRVGTETHEDDKYQFFMNKEGVVTQTKPDHGWLPWTIMGVFTLTYGIGSYIYIDSLRYNSDSSSHKYY